MVQELLSEDGQRRMHAVFTGAQQMMIGAPASFPGAGPVPAARGTFAPITDALRQQVFGYLYVEIIGILAMDGIAVGFELAQAIESFAWEKTTKLEGIARAARLEAFGRDHEARSRKFDEGFDKWTGLAGRKWRKMAGSKMKTIGFSLFFIIIGIVASTLMANMWFLWGFIFIAAGIVLPDPGENKLIEDTDFNWTRTGSMLNGRTGNRANTGLSVLKAFFKTGYVICFIYGLYATQFPLSNFLLLVLAFGFYFSMPVEFEPTKPYEFILSITRALLALFIGIFIFGLSAGSGIFQAPELGWLTLAFFLILPVATEKKNIARAIGWLGSGSGQTHDTIHMVIFIAIMAGFGINYGFSNIFSLSGEGSGMFFGTAGIVFSAVWLIGLIAGLTTPAETRPYMGIIVLIVGFVVFGLGVGQQSMGIAFFGDWWPTVHNTATEFLSPVGDMFGQFQNTFGQSWLLFTNPVGYAHQITEGTYANNELGVRGAYGLEIRTFHIQSIYIDEPFMFEIELENKGMYHAKDVEIEIFTSIRDFSWGTDPNSITSRISDPVSRDEQKQMGIIVASSEPWYKATISNRFSAVLSDIEPMDVVPVMIYGKMDCETFKKTSWQDFGSMGIGGPEGREHDVRSKFIPFYVRIRYGYESESNIQVDFISSEEWKRLSADGKLIRATKPSLISTSPANLNLGTMDQPIREDTPFYVGFNLTSTWSKSTAIPEATVVVNLPFGFGLPRCIPTTPDRSNIICADVKNEYYKCTFPLKTDSKYSSCSYPLLEEFSGAKAMPMPKKTYTVTANATYKFSKWEEKDTQFNFNDVCWPSQQTSTVSISGGQLKITSAGTMQATAGSQTTYTPTVTGGVQPYSFKISEITSVNVAKYMGTAGHNTVTGVFDLIPDKADSGKSFTFNIEVNDSATPPASDTTTLTIDVR